MVISLVHLCVVLASFVLGLIVFIAHTWYRLGKLIGEVKGHNEKLDKLTEEVKVLSKTAESKLIRRLK